MKLISWNVNGIRSALGKGFLDFVGKTSPDVLCLQEVKATANDVIDMFWPREYQQHWNSATKLGYSGTAIFTRHEPLSVTRGMGIPAHDNEGRVLNLEFPNFFLVNVYTPNSQRELMRLSYRLEWDAAFRKHLKKLEKKKPVIFCGDLNVAHTEIDLANPRSNLRNAGFTIEERASFSQTLQQGYLDTFREFEHRPGHYSWWTYRNYARERNIGWRIDYFCVSRELRALLKGASILPEVKGSDHCPVAIELGV